MASYKDYLSKIISPPFFRGVYGTSFWEIIGNSMDSIVSQSRDAVLDSVTTKAPNDALPFIGETRNIERYAADDDTSYRTRLGTPWTVWDEAGTRTGLQNRLADFGLTGSVIISWKEIEPFVPYGYEDWWSAFWIHVPFGGHSINTKKWGSSGKWGATNKVWGSTATSIYVEQLRTLIRKWKSSNEICPWVSFECSGTVVAVSIDTKTRTYDYNMSHFLPLLRVASSASITTSSMNDVLQWNDLSGHRNHLYPRTGSHLAGYSANQINGLPSVHFSQSLSSSLHTSNSLGVTTFDMYFVAKGYSSGSSQNYIYEHGNRTSISGSGSRFQLYSGGANPTINVAREKYQAKTWLSSSRADGVWRIYNHHFGGTFANDYIAEQGTVGGDLATFAGHFDEITSGAFSGSFNVGASYNPSFNEFFDGEIAEIIVFTPHLTGSEQALVADRLRNKYNLHTSASLF